MDATQRRGCIAAWLGEHRPTTTVVFVAALANPIYKVVSQWGVPHKGGRSHLSISPAGHIMPSTPVPVTRSVPWELNHDHNPCPAHRLAAQRRPGHRHHAWISAAGALLAG